MDTTPSRSRLTETIERTSRRYLSEGLAASLYDVNDGQCEDFAVEVSDALGGETERFEGTWADNLTVDGDGAEWDVALLRRLFPASEPTHGLDWEDVAACIPAHYWLVLDGRHYDAECPDGVDNLFALPILRRSLERVAESKVSGSSPSP